MYIDKNCMRNSKKNPLEKRCNIVGVILQDKEYNANFRERSFSFRFIRTSRLQLQLSSCKH